MSNSTNNPTDPKFDPEFGTIVGKRPHGAGRPRVFTAERKRMFLTLLEKGNYRKDALALVQISTASLAVEIKRDPQFKAAIRKAELKSIADAIECFSKASKKDWKAAMEFLTRKDPERWAKQSKIKLDPTSGTRKSREAVEALLAKLVPEESAPTDAGDPVEP